MKIKLLVFMLLNTLAAPTWAHDSNRLEFTSSMNFGMPAIAFERTDNYEHVISLRSAVLHYPDNGPALNPKKIGELTKELGLKELHQVELTFPVGKCVRHNREELIDCNVYSHDRDPKLVNAKFIQKGRNGEEDIIVERVIENAHVEIFEVLEVRANRTNISLKTKVSFFFQKEGNPKEWVSFNSIKNQLRKDKFRWEF